MKYTTNFAVPFWSGQTGLIYDYDKAIETCLELGTTTVNLLQHQNLKPIYDQLSIKVDKICNSIDRRFNMIIGDARIFINRNDCYARYDLESTMTVIHWIKASKNTGRHLFISGNNIEKSNRFNPFECQLFQSRIESNPATGKLIVFPSWIVNEPLPSHPDDENIILEIPLFQV